MCTPDGKYLLDMGPAGALGSGGHGVVKVARHVETGAHVAVKVMPIQNLDALVTELTAYGRVDHPNITTLLGSQIDLDKKRVFLIMELCRGGMLFDRIAECGKMSEDVAQRYFYQLASAVAHCHERSVFHRDLKPENILLDHNDNVKVADFGLAAMLSKVSEDASFLNHTKCGSYYYAAPELLSSNAEVGYDAAAADCWSLGVVLFAMLNGVLPWKVRLTHLSIEPTLGPVVPTTSHCLASQIALPADCERYRAVQEHGMVAVCEKLGISPLVAKLLEGMLNADVQSRFSIQQVLASDWLAPLQQEAEAAATVAAAAAAAGPAATSSGLASPAAGALPKWCEQLGRGVKRPLPAAQDGATGTPTQRCKALEASAPAPTATTAPQEDEEIPDGVNGMLVRSLGWVQLPSDKEQMVQKVASALDSLGVRYSVERGELAHVVTASVGTSKGGERPNATAAATEGTAQGAAGEYAQGLLTVRLRLHKNPTDDSESDLHIDREAGDVLQFHAFYRDVRNELVGVNGWSLETDRYLREGTA